MQYIYDHVFRSELVCAFVYRDILLHTFVVLHMQKYINAQSKTKVMSAATIGQSRLNRLACGAVRAWFSSSIHDCGIYANKFPRIMLIV